MLGEGGRRVGGVTLFGLGVTHLVLGIHWFLSVRDTHVQLLGKKLASKGMVWYFENHLLPAAGKTVSPQ